MTAQRPRGQILAGSAASLGALAVALRVASRIEIVLTTRAMAEQAGAACSSAGVLLYLFASWIPTLVLGGAGLGLALAAARRRPGSRLAWAALFLAAGVLAWQVLQLTGALPIVRHPCLR